MSNLLQFGGKTDRKKGVRLELLHYTGNSDTDYSAYPEKYEDVYDCHTCTVCGKVHERIYTAWCKLVGMWGCWVVFRWCNKATKGCSSSVRRRVFFVLA